MSKLKNALRMLANFGNEDVRVIDGWIYIHGKDLNQARLDRPWPFRAEFEDFYHGWQTSDFVFPGSHIPAPHTYMRVPYTPENLAFIEYTLREHLAYLWKGFRDDAGKA